MYTFWCSNPSERFCFCHDNSWYFSHSDTISISISHLRKCYSFHWSDLEFFDNFNDMVVFSRCYWRSVHFNMLWSKNLYFGILRPPKETSGRGLHAGSGHLARYWFWVKFSFCSTPFSFLQSQRHPFFVCQIWAPDRASSLPEDRARLEIYGFVLNSSIS